MILNKEAGILEDDSIVVSYGPKVDLHLHTVESDGSLSVEQVINHAMQRGVSIFSITDHESTQGIMVAQQLALKYNLRFIPGVEFLTSFNEQEVHLLGYYRTVDNSILQNRLRELREHRTALAYDMVKKLQSYGISLKWSDVERQAGERVAISRGHIMRVLYKEKGFSKGVTWQQVSGLFQPGGIAYIPFLEHPYEEAVDLIFSTGGVPVLAHPGLLKNLKLVNELLSYKPIGLEVYYGYWDNRNNQINYFADLAGKKAILMTGGSDYHGPFSRIDIGEVPVPIQCVDSLHKYLSFDGC